MKFACLIVFSLLTFQSVFASETDPSFVKYYLISTDTTATIELPKGFKTDTPQGRTSPVGKITYSDSCYIYYSIGSAIGHRLLDGGEFVQKGSYHWHHLLDDTLDREDENPKTSVFYGRVIGSSQRWEEDSICYNGLSIIRIAYVWQTDNQRSGFIHASTRLEPYATYEACRKLLKHTSFEPRKHQIAGTYEESDGLGGDDLVLNEDLSFREQGFSDIIIEGSPEPGYRGKYIVNHDTLRLQYEGYIIPASSSKQWRKELLQEDADNRKAGKIREETYIFKRAGSFLFLVEPTHLFEFAKEAVVNGGVPMLWELRYPCIALHFLTKTK